MPLRSRVREWLFRDQQPVLEAAQPKTPERAGFEFGIPPGGLNEYNQGIGAATQTDRRTLLEQLYESYVSCPWAWASVNAIARTITAGGLVTDWDSDTGEGDQEEPDKPAEVVALERLLAYVNPQDDIRQLCRNIIVDLLVFGDSFLEVVWWGSQPVALYNLDAPTMMPVADEHGTISKYVQVTDFGQRAEFDPRDIIHISLDAPRGGLFGISPTQAALLPITAWLFAAACGKEMFRKGLPPQIHTDFPAGTQQAEMNRWSGQYQARNIGPRNIGTPIMTKGGAHIAELQSGKVQDVLQFLDQKRGEILAEYGVPPAEATVIESGNLGGGTGTSQKKTFLVNTCAPIAAIVLEKLNFAIARNGFNVSGWHLKFRDVDYRDDAVIEQIRDIRLRNGSWTLDKYRADIGEPPVEGGSDPVLVDRQNLVLWADMAAMSKAIVAGKGAPAVTAGGQPPGGEQLAPDGTLQQEEPEDEDEQDGGGQQKPGKGPTREQLARYRARLAEALRVMPGGNSFAEYKDERYGA